MGLGFGGMLLVVWKELLWRPQEPLDPALLDLAVSNQKPKSSPGLPGTVHSHGGHLFLLLLFLVQPHFRAFAASVLDERSSLDGFNDLVLKASYSLLLHTLATL